MYLQTMCVYGLRLREKAPDYPCKHIPRLSHKFPIDRPISYPTLHFNRRSRRCEPKAGKGRDACSQGNRIKDKSLGEKLEHESRFSKYVLCICFIQDFACSSGWIGRCHFGQILLCPLFSSTNSTPT